MAEICFRYSAAQLVDKVAEDLRRLAPHDEPPYPDRVRSEVLHIPDPLWQRPLVPEVVLGLGGRLVDCEPEVIGPEDIAVQPEARP